MNSSHTQVGGGARRPARATPRVYIACLAAYNNGRLHGRWIDADQSPEDMWDEVQAMLAGSPESLAEEWAVHDYEGFGSLRLSASESFQTVSAIAAGIAKHGEAFAAWLAYDSSLDTCEVTRFEEVYRGEWGSLHDYAENYAEEVGMYDAAEKTGCAYVMVDTEMLERDLGIELYAVQSDHYSVYVFDPNA